MGEESQAEFMRRAIRLSSDNVRRAGGPFGAVIVKGGQVVGEGCNRVTATHDPTAHAEIVAIRDACRRLSTFDLSGAEIYTSCEPCPMCLAAIYWARLERIHFANTKEDAAAVDFDDHFIYEEIGRDPADRAIPRNQLLRDEAIKAFEDWTAHAGRIRY
ncbi:MAG: nucleoside deaminase [Planctomycetota bacterium]|jgi:guanine deaminase|nr:nucleoside deaminase [Planctomycetota bacterium]